MITFKSIEISDIEAITAMMQDFYAIDNYPMEAETTKRMFEEFISNDNFGKAWLIFADNKVAGYVILTYIFSFEYGGKIAFLDELFIKESARGKGIGKETIQFIQRESPKLSLKLLYLEVEEHNKSAQKLYIAQDFAFHNRKLMKYKIDK
jgi:ribosomal protein S18 acetylase RimI-like enzyme